MCNHVHVCIANMKTMAKLDPEMLPNSTFEHLFFKIFLGGMPPDPTSISMLHMLIVLLTIMNTQD